MKKIKLKPVKTPWRVSPSHEYIDYSGTKGEVRIKFLVHYSPKECDKAIGKLREIFGDNIPDKIWNSAGYAIAEIIFSVVYFFDMCIPQDNSGLISEEKYEFIGMTCSDSLSNDEFWNATNVCPDPGFYEVLESDIKINMGVRTNDVRHWMMFGHDSYFNILAESFRIVENPIS